MTLKTNGSPVYGPFFEGFNDKTFVNDCGKIEQTVQTGTLSTLWSLNQTANFTSFIYEGDGCLQLLDGMSGNKSIIVLPLRTRETANDYLLKFMMYRSTLNKTDEGVKVWINDLPTLEGATEMLYIHRYTNATPIVSGAGWYAYMDTIRTSGNEYMTFEGIGDGV